MRLFYGHFQQEKQTCSVPTPPCASGMRDYYHSKEKQTDVGIAVEIVADACSNAYDMAVLVSGDSDLVPAVKKVRELGKTVHVYVPHRGTSLGQYARELRDAASTYAQLPHALFPKVLLPDSVSTPSGQVAKPQGW